MVTIKHKVTIKTKTAQEKLHVTVESPEVAIKTKRPEQNLEPKNVSVMPELEKPSNTGKIIGGIVAAAAIFIGIYFFGIRDNGSDANISAPTNRVAQTEEATGSGNSENVDKTNAESATTNAETTKPSEVNKTQATAEEGNAPAKVDEKKAEKQSVNETQAVQQPSLAKQTTTTTSQEFSTPINGDVEENARRVIRGDFGNGQTRKDKLGSSYSEIQGRVNEMYRQGLVR